VPGVAAGNDVGAMASTVLMLMPSRPRLLVEPTGHDAARGLSSRPQPSEKAVALDLAGASSLRARQRRCIAHGCAQRDLVERSR